MSPGVIWRMIVGLLAISSLRSQSTQGLIFGTVLDAREGRHLLARLSAVHIATNLRVQAVTDGSGHYALPLLPPGLYRIRVESPGYQAQELYELDLSVAAFLNVEFHLRPLEDVWE